MTVMKKIENEVPFKSGCDNEADPLGTSELQLGREELLEMHSSASSAATSSNAALAATKAEDKRKADELRKASLGILSTDELRDLRNGKKKRKASANCVSPPPNYDGMLAFTTDLQGRLEERKMKRDRDRIEKLALKTKKLELKKERDERNFRLQVEAENKRIEMDQSREDRIFKLQEQSLQLQAEMFRFFQQQVPKTNDDIK